MQDRLLNAYLVGTVEEVVFKAKSNELRAELAKTDEALTQLGDTAPARGETCERLDCGGRQLGGGFQKESQQADSLR